MITVGVASIFVRIAAYSDGPPLYALVSNGMGDVIGRLVAGFILFSPLLIIVGVAIIHDNPVYPYVPPAPVARTHQRKFDKTFDDAQEAFDTDIDKAMRGEGGYNDRTEFRD